MCQPQQTGPDHKRNRKTVNLYQCHQTGPVSGETVNCCQSVSNVNCLVVNPADIVQGQQQRKGISLGIVRLSVIKICEQCFPCRSIVFCQTCTKCPKSCTKSACRGQTKQFLGNLGSLGGLTQSRTDIERGLHPTFSNQTKLDRVTDNHQLLCTSPQEPLPV